MNAAEKLRSEMLNGGIIDKNKVLNIIANGIRENGYCLVWEPYNTPSQIRYRDCTIEISDLKEEVAIKELALKEGFHVRNAYHPASGRPYGIEISL